MSTQSSRDKLLSGLPLQQRRLDIEGIPTAVLEGGHGRPLLLLRGTQEGGLGWWPIIPQLVERFRVVVPDLPGLGESETGPGRLDAGTLTAWLATLIAATCDEQPTLIGHSMGGAIAARFATERSDRLRRLVLVDAVGLGPFRPSRGFLVAMLRGMLRPSPASVERLWDQAMHDLHRVGQEHGEQLVAHKQYLASRARQRTTKKAMRQLGKSGTKAIPHDQLRKIDVPTVLIWGRYDRATSVSTAQAASNEFGWPLHVVDDAGHIPYLEQTRAFVAVLHAAVLGMSGDRMQEARQ